MRKRFEPGALFLAGLLLVLGCSDNKNEDEDTSDDGSGGNRNTDVGGGGNIDDIDSANVCDLVEQGVGKTTGKVMLLQDISSSMSEELGNGQSKWEVARQALTNMVNEYNAEVEFGLDLFPVAEECIVGTSAAIDTAPNNAQTVAGELAATELSRTTPLYLAMSNFLDQAYAPNLTEQGADSYLVVISDGQDSCGKDGQFQGNVSPQDLASVTNSLLSELGIKTFVIGFGSGVDPQQLNAIAEAGGTQYDTYFDAQDEDALNTALDSIGQAVVVSCLYQIGDVDPTADLDLTNIYFDGNGLLRGNSCDGDADWAWGNDEKTQIEFCPAACSMLESGEVEELKVLIMCTEDDVIIV